MNLLKIVNKSFYDLNKKYDNVQEPYRILTILLPVTVVLIANTMGYHITSATILLTLLAIRMSYIHKWLKPYKE